MAHTEATTGLYGLLVEFETPEQVVDAARKVRAEGYTAVEGYTPYPVEELFEALDHKRTILPVIIFLGGLFGFLGGYGLEYWASVLYYPMNIGGRPFHSWPAFVPPAFETTILLGSLTAAGAMLLANGLPRPHHPLFGVPAFDRATDDRFFLCIESTDPKFDRDATFNFLRSLNPHEVLEVPA